MLTEGAVDYYLKEGLQKSTAFFHSERVILHALKQKQNVTKILTLLHDRVQARWSTLNGHVGQNYRIQAVNLILYSHPNSVCQECSSAIIAAQQPANTGFLYELQSALKQTECPFKGPLDSNRQPISLPLNAIVASTHIFSTDPSGQIIKKQPLAKLPFSQANVATQLSGIFVGQNHGAAKNYFYEFAESSISESTTMMPYEGMIAMSGSKSSKLTSVNLEPTLQKLINQHNRHTKATL